MTKQELIVQANNLVKSLQINSTKYGAGIIDEVKDLSLQTPIISNSEAEVANNAYVRCTMLIKFNNTQATFGYAAGKNKALSSIPVLDNFLQTTAFTTLLDLDQQAYKAKENQRELAKQEKENLARSKKIEVALKKLNGLSNEDIAKDFDSTSRFFYVLGWIAGHTSSIRAAMPDYAENWFISKFGNVPHTTVDSNKRTINNNPMQWALSMHISFKKAAYTPYEVESKFKTKVRQINSVSFVWDLIENYNFVFGRTQDINAIRSTVPENYLADFDLGVTTK